MLLLLLLQQVQQVLRQGLQKERKRKSEKRQRKKGLYPVTIQKNEEGVVPPSHHAPGSAPHPTK